MSIIEEMANEEYGDSLELTKKLTNFFIQHEHSYTVSKMEFKIIGAKNSQFTAWQNNLHGIRLNNIAQEQGWST